MYVILFLHVVLYHVIPLPSNEITHLLWYYEDFPTACNPFVLLLFVVRHTTYALLIFCNIWYGDYRLSPVDTMSLFNMADLRPRGAVYILTKTTYTHFAFRYEQNVGTPICYISGLKCLMTLLPCCLRLAHTVTSAHPRLATGGLVNPFQTGFPPIKHCTLCWAHAHSNFHIWFFNCINQRFTLFIFCLSSHSNKYQPNGVSITFPNMVSLSYPLP